MKQFRPYLFPPLTQVLRPRAGAGAEAAASQEAWQGAVEDGYRQGQHEGYDAGLEQGRAEGYPLGHAEGVVRGLDEGRGQAQDHFEQIAGPVDAMLDGLKKLERDLREAQRTEVVDLVGKIARQVIRAELALQPVQLLNLVDEALSTMPPSRDEVEVYLNPEELKRISELDPKRARKWRLLADPGMAPGECRVKAGDHEVDAGCQGRLAAVMEQVSEQLAAAEEED
ncbi:MAG: flagellar assembly protein FliH [Massilia sp.]